MFLMIKNNFKIIKNIKKYSNKSNLHLILLPLSSHSFPPSFSFSSNSLISSSSSSRRIFLNSRITTTRFLSTSSTSGIKEQEENNENKQQKEEKEEKEQQTEQQQPKEEDGTSTSTSSTTTEVNQQPIDYVELLKSSVSKSRSFASSFVVGLKETWRELLDGPKDSKIKKTVAHSEVARAKQASQNNSDEDEDEDQKGYEGPTALVVSKTKRSTWEEMAARLENSPLIREMLKNSRRITREAAATDLGKQAQQISEKVSNKIHDAREFWETTQNPIVYQISGAWESMTAPTEEGMAVAEIQKLDPEFVKEDWASEIKREVTPLIIKAHIEGDLKTLRPRLGEAVYNKLAADIRTRKADGITIDPRVLDIDELQIVIRYLETEGPIILAIYMVQQVNCIRNREGEIIEGGENNIIAKFYTLAFKQIYNDDEGIVDWKIVDYELSGGETYF